MAAATEGLCSFQLVVAATRKLGIGKNGTMPWKLPADMAYFKELTSKTKDPNKQNAVVMGRKTWEGIPSKFRPLPGRINVVLSRSTSSDENCAAAGNSSQVKVWSQTTDKQSVRMFSSLESVLKYFAGTDLRSKVEEVFVIGGGQIYEEAVHSPLCSAIHMTQVEQDFECDTFFPALQASRWRLWSATPPKRDKDSRISFLCYVPASQTSPPSLPPAISSRHEEHQVSRKAGGQRLLRESCQCVLSLANAWLVKKTIPAFACALSAIQHCKKLKYLEMVADVMENGAFRPDRTGTGTVSKFGCQMRFNLRHSFPLLTTKRVFWRGVVEELLWFVRGETNAKSLKDKGVHIWDGNSSRSYLDSIGLTDREEDDLGPVYGFQWRHFGAEYTDMHADYSGQGVDQLAEVVHKLRTNPSDRRIVLSAWNPKALPKMALPPCHMFAQFYVADGELSCQMYQRSADLGLGVPFNIASYALLTYMLAQVAGLRPGEFVHVLGDAHVYANHLQPLKEQLKNSPRPFPVLKIREGVKEIGEFCFEDLELVGYNPHQKIAMKMAV